MLKCNHNLATEMKMSMFGCASEVAPIRLIPNGEITRPYDCRHGASLFLSPE